MARSGEARLWRVVVELAAERAFPSGVTGPWDFFPLAREAARRRLEDMSAPVYSADWRLRGVDAAK